MSYNTQKTNTVLISTPYSNPNSEMLKRHQDNKSINTNNIAKHPIDKTFPTKPTLDGNVIENIKQEAFTYSQGVLMHTPETSEDIQMNDEELKELINNGVEDITEFNEDISLPYINGVEPIIDSTVTVVTKDNKDSKSKK